MKNVSAEEAIKRIDDAHGSITCATSVIDILQNIDPESYANTNILAGDISNTLALVSEKLSEQLEVIEMALSDIKEALSERE